MAKNYNFSVLEGHLTKDAVVSKGTVRFTLGCNRGSKADGTDAGADFISCVAFGTCAEYLTANINGGYLKKGTHIIVMGSIQTGSYDKDGVKIYTTDVCVSRYNLILDVPKETTSQQAPQQPMPQQAPQGGFPPQQPMPQQAPQGGFPPQQPMPQQTPQGFPPQQQMPQQAPQGFPTGTKLPWA